MNRLFPILLTLAGVVAQAGEADAQYPFRRLSGRTSVTYAAPASTGTTTYSSFYGPTSAAQPQPARTYTYSYYSLSPLPARTYVGYGDDQFPYQGRPYGHSYDPWTWSTLSGSYGNGLARYYDPPVK
jgi:hypothetical protein